MPCPRLSGKRNRHAAASPKDSVLRPEGLRLPAPRTTRRAASPSRGHGGRNAKRGKSWGAPSKRFVQGAVFRGGDSGGGLFDLDGRVLGTLRGQRSFGRQQRGAEYGRVELFQTQWDILIAAKPVTIPSPPNFNEICDASAPAAKRLPSMVAEVLVKSTGKRRALGTVVGPHGYILTKASELDGELLCRFSDGRVFPAVIHRVSRDDDLALLKVNADNLPSLDWGAPSETTVGTLVARYARTRNHASASSAGRHARFRREPARDLSWFAGLTADAGSRWRKIRRRSKPSSPLPGDILRHVEGQAVADLKTFLELSRPGAHALPRCAGDPIRVGIQ